MNKKSIFSALLFRRSTATAEEVAGNNQPSDLHQLPAVKNSSSRLNDKSETLVNRNGTMPAFALSVIDVDNLNQIIKKTFDWSPTFIVTELGNLLLKAIKTKETDATNQYFTECKIYKINDSDPYAWARFTLIEKLNSNIVTLFGLEWDDGSIEPFIMQCLIQAMDTYVRCKSNGCMELRGAIEFTNFSDRGLAYLKELNYDITIEDILYGSGTMKGKSLTLKKVFNSIKSS